MANTLWIFAVDRDVVASATMSVTVVDERLLRRAVRSGRFRSLQRAVRSEQVPWVESFADADPEDQGEWLYGQPDGVRSVGVTFRPEYRAIEDLTARIVAHLDDPGLAVDLTQDEGRPRAPAEGAIVGRTLAQGTWRVYTRDEMRRLAGAIGAALGADPAWATDEYTLSAEWRALAEDLATAHEDFFVWAFWN